MSQAREKIVDDFVKLMMGAVDCPGHARGSRFIDAFAAGNHYS